MPDRPEFFLIVRAGSLRCALPLSRVREVMRPLPLKAARGAVPGVVGAAVVRGEPLAVISLCALLDQAGGAEARFVVVHTAGRACVLAVDGVEAIAPLEESAWQKLPKLLQNLDAADEIAAVDEELVVTLNLGRVLEKLPPAAEVQG